MNVADSARGLLAFAAWVWMAGCQSAAAPEREAVDGGADPKQRLGQLIDDLYVAFSFDAQGGPDEAFLRSVFADGATFVSPPSSGESPKGVGDEVAAALDVTKRTAESDWTFARSSLKRELRDA